MTVEQSIEDQLNARKEKNKAEQKWSYQSKTAADLLLALGEKDVSKSDHEAKLISRASAAMREARQLHRYEGMAEFVYLCSPWYEYRDVLKSGPVLHSKSQARPGR